MGGAPALELSQLLVSVDIGQLAFKYSNKSHTLIVEQPLILKVITIKVIYNIIALEVLEDFGLNANDGNKLV